MKFFAATLFFFVPTISSAEDWTGSDAVFYQQFVPADSVTAEHQDVLEWKIRRCIHSQDGAWLIEYELVGHDDPEMESFVLSDGNQPIFANGRWVPTLGFDIEEFCISATS